MCLIIAKDINVVTPSNNQLRRWHKVHSDGFGVMFLHNNKVHIIKGMLSIKDILQVHNRIKTIVSPVKLTEIPIVYHFRQATDGSICPANTHPFPITDDKLKLSQLELITDIGIVHNGIISKYSTYSWYNDYTYVKPVVNTDLTDTAQFIIEYLAGMRGILHNNSVQKLINDYTHSKFCILTKHGIEYIGQYITDAGLKYSNDTYKAKITHDKPIQALSYNYYYDDVNLTCGHCKRTYKLEELIDDGYGYLCDDCAQILFGKHHSDMY